MDVMPPSNLPEPSQKWGRRHDQDHLRYDLTLERTNLENLNNNKQLNASLNLLNSQVADLNGAIGTLTAQQELLAALQETKYAEFISTFTPGVAGWYGTSGNIFLDIVSPTGRIEIGYGGSMNGGNGYFCYQVLDLNTGNTIVNRESVRTNPAKRIAMSGGASFVPSSFKAGVPVDVTAGNAIRVQLHVYANDAFATFFGGSLSVKVSP